LILETEPRDLGGNSWNCKRRLVWEGVVSDETIDQLLAMMQEMNAAIRQLAENFDQLRMQGNNNGKAIADLLHVASNHAETLRVAQAAVERLWRECGLPFDDPSPQAN
jgi:hypothetical protein